MQADASSFCPAPRCLGAPSPASVGLNMNGEPGREGRSVRIWAPRRANAATQPPGGSEHGYSLFSSASKRGHRRTLGCQFSTHFQGMSVFESLLISPIKICYPGCFVFQISVGKATKVDIVTLSCWLQSRHFASTKPGLVPETCIALPFDSPLPVPSNPPTC